MGLLDDVHATPKGLAGVVTNYKYDREEMVCLAIAFARKEVTSTQVSKAMGVKTGAHTLLATVLMTALRHGRLQIPEDWK